MNTVIGHKQVLYRMYETISQGRQSHAYLITGPNSVGKKLVAQYIASRLNCENLDRFSCGECQQCRRIAKGVHADCEIVSVDYDGSLHVDGKKRTVITIEQIRKIIRECHLKPYEGKYRVYVVEAADRMSDEASNALLKTLEEPPDQVVIILLTSTLEKILPTLSSRTQVISLKTVNWPELKQGLIDCLSLEDGVAEELAKTCGGKPGIAIKLFQEEDYKKWRSDALNEVEFVAMSRLQDRFVHGGSFAKRYAKDREGVLAILTLWQEWWIDVLVCSFGLNDSIINQSRIDNIVVNANKFGSFNSAKTIRIISTTIEKLQMNFNPSLTIEQMMLKMPIISK